jgi:ABC-type multidrug transport system ATPase subunit
VLCDRVAVLVGGKLQGVGTLQEIVSIEVQAMEVLFELPAGRSVPTALAGHVTPSGGAYRLDVPEAELYDAISQLRAAEAQILSVTQLKPTLEDYFFQLVGREKAPSYAVEVAHK